MKTMLFVPLFLLAACANPPVENVPVPPPQPSIETRPSANPVNDPASERFLKEQLEKKQETSRAEPRGPAREPTNDAASDRFLFEEILRHQETARYEERRRAEAEAAARAQQQAQAERVVYVDRQQAQGQPYADQGPYRPATFPVGTILGGTVGGIIGNQSNQTAEGIAIGSGVGLLLDMLTGYR